MDRTSLDCDHLFKNGLSTVIKLPGVMTPFLILSLSCHDAVVTSDVHSFTDMYPSRCFKLLTLIAYNSDQN